MYNDYELLYLAGENNEEAINILYEKYKGLIYNKAIKYNDSYLTLQDYLNETLYAFYEAIENYKDKVSFNTYLSKCIDNKLLNYKKSLDRNKNKILNESVPLTEYIDILVSLENNKLNPEEIIIDNLVYNDMRERIINKLTWKEELIFNLKEQNYNLKEIAEITDNNLRTVYNIIDRIKNKVSSIMSNCCKYD